MYKSNSKTVVFLLMMFLIALSNSTVVLAMAQFCEEPYCGGTTPALLEYLSNGQNHAGLTMPDNINNPALLNMESGSAPSGVVFNSAFKIGGSKVTQIGGTAIDADSNYYVTGGFTGMIDFGTTTLTSSKGYDFYVAKFDNAGNLLWARTARGMLTLPENLAIEGGVTITVDESGDCYVGGAFVKSMSFLDETGNVITELNDSKEDSTINFEMFIAKYSSSGELLWAKGGNSGSAGSLDNLATGLNSVNSVILDGDGYPYIGGTYFGTNFLGESVTPQGGSDFFIASLDPDNGSVIWNKLVGTPNNDAVLSLSIDSYGYINALGSMGQGVLVFPDWDQTYNNDTGSDDTFVISFDINGEWYFAVFLGGDQDVIGNDIDSDPEGNIYVTGEFSGTLQVDSSALPPNSEGIVLNSTGEFSDGFVGKSDLNGYVLWARRFGGNTFTKGRRIVVDEQGNSYVLGVFTDYVVFDEDSGNPDTLFSNALADMFVAKYDTDGKFQWAKQIDGSGSEGLDLLTSAQVPVRTNPVDLLYSKNNGGELILSGDFNNSLFLDNITLQSSESTRSGFVAVLDVSKATGIEDDKPGLTEFMLSQNYPNPFNPSTRIDFNLPASGKAKVTVFNQLGQQVTILADGIYSAGVHEINFNADNLASGVYYYRIDAGTFSQTKKMILLK